MPHLSAARAIVWCALVLFAPFAAATCYVKHDATGNNGGASWDNAYTDLQSALANYPTCADIYVARGTYKPTQGNDRAVSFSIRPGVFVYGGFAGNEAALEDRFPGAYTTVLSGDIGVAGDVSDNSYHVVLLDGTSGFGPINGATALSDLTIRDGNANGSAFGAYQDSGGGVLCRGEGAGHECSPTLVNLVLEKNQALYGGAIYNLGNSSGKANPEITNVIFRDNSATYLGGAIENSGAVAGTSSPLIQGASFSNNTAQDGGAIANAGGGGTASPTIRNSTFYANSAQLGGAIANAGQNGGHASPLLRYVTFSQNHATAGAGGAIYNLGNPGGDAAPSISGAIFWGDTSTVAPQEMLTQSPTTPLVEYSITSECPVGATGCFNADPRLGPLQDNGGFAPSMRPEIDSPALEAGNLANCPAFDQRGILRPQGAQCDIGAVELQPAEKQRCYVNTAAGATQNGQTWATAYKTLTPALVDASCSEVWVAQGTYKSTTGVSRTSTFFLPPGKAVYGGFAGTETQRGQRDPASHVTILSGEIGAAGAGDNVYHVIAADAQASAADIGGNTVLDGFTISGGNADGSNEQGYGGGFFCNGQVHACRPSLSHLVFTGNGAADGGALANYGFSGVASPTLTNVAFTSNSATDKGGAVFNLGGGGVSSPVMTDVTFTGNYAAHDGGAMASSGIGGASDPRVSAATFTGNSATFGGGALYIAAADGTFTDVDFFNNTATAIGGAVEIDDTSGPSSPAFASVNFVGNTATNGAGGAVIANLHAGSAPSFHALNCTSNSGSPGGCVSASGGSLTFDHSTFDSNTGITGGAVQATGGSMAFTDVLFLRNGHGNATQSGGAIAVIGGNASVVVDRAAFIDNEATQYGGAVWTSSDASNGATTQITNATFWGNHSVTYGSAVANKSVVTAVATTVLTSITAAMNVADNNFTIYNDGASGSGSGHLSIIDSILYANSKFQGIEIFAPPTAVTTADNSIIQGSCVGFMSCSFVTGMDPLLGILQYNSGPTPTMMPAANSPAIGFGANCPAVDQRGIARPQGAGCDAGAVERRNVEDELFSTGFDF